MSLDRANAIEVCAQFSIKPEKLKAFRQGVLACTDRVRKREPGALRYDWFIDEAGTGDGQVQAVAMEAYQDEQALLAHMGNLREYLGAVLANASASLSFLGHPGDVILQATQALGLRRFDFFGGISGQSAAGRFQSHTQNGEGRGGSRHIEILAGFQVFPGKWERFSELALEHINIVRSKDPGTLRYDWFLDETHLECTTMDTYQDAAGMFAHMRNCHEIHGEFQQLSAMSTQFLGALPADAAVAVAKFQPRVLPFFSGLKTYSSGGFD